MEFSQSNKSLHWYPLWLLLGISLVLVVIYLSLTAKPPEIVSFAFSDKIGHFLAYAVLMGWFGQIFNGRSHLILFALGFVLMGISLEYVQGMGRHRHFEYADMVANTIGVGLGLLLTVTVFKGSLHWVEQRVLSGRIKT
jgi:VanZ family protein